MTDGEPPVCEGNDGKFYDGRPGKRTKGGTLAVRIGSGAGPPVLSHGQGEITLVGVELDVFEDLINSISSWVELRNPVPDADF